MRGIFSILTAIAVWAVLTFSMYGIVLVVPWIALIFLGADGRAKKAFAKQATTLMAGEQIIQQAMQHRAFGLLGRRLVFAITDSRIILMKRGRLGGFKMKDIQWKDLQDVTIEENALDGICGANLTFHNYQTFPIVVVGVPSAVATKIYALSQREEQTWEEKHRIRGMEEDRAGFSSRLGWSAASGDNRVVDEIARAQSLLDSGAITDVEFQEMKAKILATV